MSPRGRRPVGEDTRGLIVDAARAEFGSGGFDATSLRAVARRAGVDAALVHHYFDGKAALFAEVMELPLDPAQLVEAIASGPREGVGERMVRAFLGVWDSPGGRVRFQALIRSVSSHEEAARMLREFVVAAIFTELVRRLADEHELSTPQLETRASLAAAQMVGMGMLRYVIELPAMVDADVEEVVGLLAPVLQHYIVGGPSW